jgi:hypothetical protein
MYTIVSCVRFVQNTTRSCLMHRFSKHTADSSSLMMQAGLRARSRMLEPALAGGGVEGHPSGMITARISADRWLWTAEMGDPATGHVCNGRPLRAARYEGAGLHLIAVHEINLPAGTLLITTPAGMSSRGAGPWGGSHAVHRLGADGSLARVLVEEAADQLDPAGSEARLHRRLALAAGLSLETVRLRMRDGHGYEGGTVVEWAG